jgi:hypothetical protein
LCLRERNLDCAAAHIQHVQKALTFMNLQLHHVVADVAGATQSSTSVSAHEHQQHPNRVS